MALPVEVINLFGPHAAGDDDLHVPRWLRYHQVMGFFSVTLCSIITCVLMSRAVFCHEIPEKCVPVSCVLH